MKYYMLLTIILLFSGCATPPNFKQYEIKLLESGKPIAGASVVIGDPNKTTGAFITDKNGKVTLSCQPNEKITFLKDGKKLFETNASALVD